MHKRPGWRSERSANAMRGFEGAVRPTPASPTRSQLAAFGEHLSRTASRFRAIEWTLAYAAFIVYVFVATTYRFPLGRGAMIVALLGLLFMRQRLRATPLLFWFGLFWLWLGFGYLLAPWEGSRFEPFYHEEMTTQLIDMTKIWLICFVAVNVLRSRSQVRFYMVFFLACFAIYPARGTIVNYFTGNTRWGRAAWDHIFGNPNAMASLSILAVGIAAALLPVERNKLFRLGAVSTIVVLPVVILFTQSRAGFIGLALFGAFALAGRINLKRLVPLALVIVLSIFYAPQGIWDRMAGLVQTRDPSQLSELEDMGSAEARWNIWILAGRIIRDHPFTGVGFGGYQYVHADYGREVFLSIPRTTRGLRDTHSTYLNVLAEAGIPGLVLLLAIVAATILRAEVTRRRARRVLPEYSRQIYLLEAAIVGYLTAGIFGTYHKFVFPYLYLALIWVLVLMLEKDLAAARSGVAQTPPPTLGRRHAK
jgi:O-antigen ligase